MKPPLDLPLWRRALAMGIANIGVLGVCLAAMAQAWWLTLAGIVVGVACVALGCAVVAQRITCRSCGASIISVGGRPRKCPVKNCTRCGVPFFLDTDDEPTPAQRMWTRLLVWFGVFLFFLYVGAYVTLSRQGYAEADHFNIKGFYYFSPEDTEAWRWKNYGCVYVFCPLNVVDRSLGYGHAPASEPLWGLSR
jgi:hypothetical protein